MILKCFRWVYVIALLGSAVLWANEPRTIYREIYAQISAAENNASGGDFNNALKNYQEVLFHLENFQKQYPDWEPDIVKFRVQYTKNQIQQIQTKISTEQKTIEVTPTNANEVAKPSSATVEEPLPTPPAIPAVVASSKPETSPPSVVKAEPLSIDSSKAAATAPQPSAPVAQKPAVRPTKILPPAGLSKYMPSKSGGEKTSSDVTHTEIASVEPASTSVENKSATPPVEQKPLVATPPKAHLPPPGYVPSLPKPPTPASIPKTSSGSAQVTAVSPAPESKTVPASSAHYSAPAAGPAQPATPDPMVLAQPALKTQPKSTTALATLQSLAQETEAKISRLEKENKSLKSALAEAQSRADVSGSYVKVLTRENELLQNRLNREIKKLEALQALLYTELAEHTSRWDALQKKAHELLGDIEAPYESPLTHSDSSASNVIEDSSLQPSSQESAISNEEAPTTSTQ
ncbi:MAG: hypothetical protein ACOY3I_00100 [Verrucomicrobiota bacterium]